MSHGIIKAVLLFSQTAIPGRTWLTQENRIQTQTCRISNSALFTNNQYTGEHWIGWSGYAVISTDVQDHKVVQKLLLCMTRHKNLQQPHNLESHESRGKNGLPGLQTENRPTAWLRSVMCNAFYILRVKISTTINPPFERKTFYHTHPTKRGKQIYQSSMLNVQQQGHQKKNTSNGCGMQRCSHVVWALFQDSTLATTSKGKIV
jgi:hypothetical protein